MRGAQKSDYNNILNFLINNQIIFHWFSGSFYILKDVIRSNVYFSINLKMLQNKKGQDIVKNIPLSNILTESDYPYTYKGNYDLMYIEKTIEVIAKIKNINYIDMKIIIYKNFINMIN